MASTTPELPVERHESFTDDLAGIPNFLIDAPAAARRLNRRWFWVGPVVLFSIVTLLASLVMMPMFEHVMQNMPVPEGQDPERFQKGLQLGITIQQVTVWLAPITTMIIFAIQALVVWATGAGLALRTSFRQMFNLIAGCSIIQLLAAVAGVIVLKLKGEPSTVAGLRPAMGLDLFLPEDTNRFLAAALGYFSVFEIWWIVMMVLIISAAYRVSKGKAFAVVLPLVILSICLRVVGALSGR